MPTRFEAKQRKINEFLSYVKSGSIILSGIILMKNILGDSSLIYESNQKMLEVNLALLSTCLISGLYYLWLFIFKRKVTQQHRFLVQTLECCIFTLFFAVIILLTGNHESNYKILFMFAIIPFTIEIGIRAGFIVASFSSLFMLSIDLIFYQTPGINPYFENDLVISAIFFLTAWLLGYYVKMENDHIQMLENKINLDGLTGLYNHRYFYEELTQKVKNFKQDGTPVALVFMDIDYFKQYNDMFGHLSGDQVLRDVRDMLKRVAKHNVTLARYGGDEFAAIVTNTSLAKANTLGEHIRMAMEEMHFDGEEHLPSEALTMSIGVAMCNEDIKNEVELVKCADDALYRAKFFKKNRVEVYSSILDMLKTDIETDHIDLISSVKTFISIINAKDRYTYGHVERVVMYARILAKKLGLSEKDRKNLILGAYMHDIGKINIADNILNKKMPLTDEEWEILKDHPVNGVNMIHQMESLSEISPLIHYHHERYDGQGYPDGLKEEAIPFLARALTIIDSFDAMTFNRPYKPARTFSEAADELKKCSGSQFDPEITDAFLEVIREMKKDINTYAPNKPERHR